MPVCGFAGKRWSLFRKPPFERIRDFAAAREIANDCKPRSGSLKLIVRGAGSGECFTNHLASGLSHCRILKSRWAGSSGRIRITGELWRNPGTRTDESVRGKRGRSRHVAADSSQEGRWGTAVPHLVRSRSLPRERHADT